jgi:hypothetical protein
MNTGGKRFAEATRVNQAFNERNASTADSGKIHAMNLVKTESTRSGGDRLGFCIAASTPLVLYSWNPLDSAGTVVSVVECHWSRPCLAGHGSPTRKLAAEQGRAPVDQYLHVEMAQTELGQAVRRPSQTHDFQHIVNLLTTEEHDIVFTRRNVSRLWILVRLSERRRTLSRQTYRCGLWRQSEPAAVPTSRKTVESSSMAAGRGRCSN